MGAGDKSNSVRGAKAVLLALVLLAILLEHLRPSSCQARTFQSVCYELREPVELENDLLIQLMLKYKGVLDRHFLEPR